MKTMMKILFGLLLPFWTTAQVPQVMWEKTIGGTNLESFNSILPISSGKYILSGTSNSNISGDKTQNSKGGNDFWILKMNSFGNLEWDKTIGGGSDDYLFDIVPTKEGGYLIGGSSNSNISGDKSQVSKGVADYWVVKIDSNGIKQWDKTIGGSYYEILTSILPTSDGGYILGGQSLSNISGDKSQNSKGDFDFWIVKIDSLGNIIWDETIGGSGSDEFTSIIQCNDGGYLLGGYSLSNYSGDKKQNSRGLHDYWIVKIDFNGNVLWSKTFGGFQQDLLYAMLPCQDGGYILGGYSNSDISVDKSQNIINGTDYWIVKIDSVGNILWDKTIGGTGLDDLQTITNSLDGGFLLGGISTSEISGNKTQKLIGYEDYWIVKIDSIGNILWDKTIGGSKSDQLYSIIPCQNGEYMIGGRSISNISGDKFQNSIGGYDYWIVKLGNPKNKITGNVFADLNSNCNNNNEPRLKNKLIRNISENTYSVTNDSLYTLYTFTNDTALLTIANLESIYQVSCNRDTIPIIFSSSFNKDTQNVNFPIRPKGNICFQPKISSFSHSRLVRCMWSNYILNYQNEGFDTLFNAKITLEIDTNQIDSFKSVYPFTRNGNIVVFNLGNLLPVAYRSLTYSIKVKCNALIGSSNCHRAAISPLNDCYSYPNYDSSNIQISQSCKNDTVTIKIENMGFAKDMTKLGTIKAYEDELILVVDTFKLNKNTSKIYQYIPKTNRVLTIIADPKNGDPNIPILIRHDDHCAIKTPILFNNPVLNFSRYDEANEYEEDCDIIRSSYDPNEKSVQPVGLFTQHYTQPNETLKYRIDFQNVGTDTAFKVVVVDTLSSFLNLESIEPGASSHPYSIEIAGANILKFIFDPIKLVDSLTNEPSSHGYVNFKIKAKSTIPLKAVVKNFADIYFDYNAPVRTNTVFNTMYDTIQIDVPKKDSTNRLQDFFDFKTSLHVYPNPSTDKFIIHLNDFREGLSVELFDLNGKLVYNMNQITTDMLEINAVEFNNGIYILEIKDDKGVLVKQKISIER